jgi:hypothetical protein
MRARDIVGWTIVSVEQYFLPPEDVGGRHGRWCVEYVVLEKRDRQKRIWLTTIETECGEYAQTIGVGKPARKWVRK